MQASNLSAAARRKQAHKFAATSFGAVPNAFEEDEMSTARFSERSLPASPALSNLGQLGTLSDIPSIYRTDESIRNLSQGNNTNATREISSNHSLPLLNNLAPMSISSHEVHPPLTWTLGPSCFFLAFASMSPWTVVGSLISYFQKDNGPDFFVKLNCAFYLPGLPVALLQVIYVSDLEVRFGSQPITLARNLLAFFTLVLIMAVVPSIPVEDGTCWLWVTGMMGAASWLAHGTTTSLASMFPSGALSWLQTGFRMPEVYAFAMISLLQPDSQPQRRVLRLLFHVTAGLVALGAGIVLYVMSHPLTRRLLVLKEQGGQGAAPLRTEEKEGCGGPDRDEAPLSSDARRDMSLNPPPNSTWIGRETTFVTVCDSDWTRFRKRLSKPPDMRPRSLTETEKDFVETSIASYRWTLLVTIASSLFQASLLAYVRSARPNRRGSICEVLYFARLFADLLGRPLVQPLLSRLRPPQQPFRLFLLALVRLSLLPLFLAYIALPDSAPRSDFLITLLVALFALSSGIFVVLSYEFARRSVGPCKAYQAYSGTVMDLHFQAAGFLGMLCGLLYADAASLATKTEDRKQGGGHR